MIDQPARHGARHRLPRTPSSVAYPPLLVPDFRCHDPERLRVSGAPTGRLPQRDRLPGRAYHWPYWP